MCVRAKKPLFADAEHFFLMFQAACLHKKYISSWSSLSSKNAFLDDSDMEQEEDEDMLLSCVLIGEYLSEKEERPTFYVRNRMEW